MIPTPREVLIDIVAKYGEPLLASPLRTEGLLKDYCGEFRREIFVLVSCLRVGVVDQLLRQGGPSVKLVCARLALKLEQNLAISGDVAKWAVESWAIALGLLQPEFATAKLDDIFDLSARTLRMDPPALPLPEPAAPASEEVAASLEAPSTRRVSIRSPETELPPKEEPPVEFHAQEPEPGWPVPDWSHPAASVIVYPDSSGQKPTLRDAVRDGHGQHVPGPESRRLSREPGHQKGPANPRRWRARRSDDRIARVVGHFTGRRVPLPRPAHPQGARWEGKENPARGRGEVGPSRDGGLQFNQRHLRP